MCAWSLEFEGNVLSHSESSRSTMEQSVQALTNLELQAVTLEYPGLETVFVFENQFALRTFAMPFDPSEDEYWKLHMPDHNVLTIGDHFYSLIK
jgi:hypothetical protein